MTLAFLLLCVIPPPEIVRDSVDVIELNHHHNNEGEVMYDQIIFWS